MLPGFLTTSLEIIIILDVCGAIVYFTLSGLTRIRQKQAKITPPPLPLGLPGLRPATQSASPVAPADRSVFSVYAAPEPAAEPEQGFGFRTGFRRRITSFKDKFTYRPFGGNRGVQTQDMGAENQKLGRILDSFKEET